MIRMLVISVALLMMWGTAFAQDEPYIPFEENTYTDNYFGTQLVVFTTQRLTKDDSEWWTDRLPPRLFSDQESLYELVNAAREGTDRRLLDPLQWYIESGWEGETDGGWEYELNFFDMRPSEVMLIVEELGGIENLIPGGQISLMPCLHRSFYASSAGFDELFTLILSDNEYHFSPQMDITELSDEVGDAFLDAYGQEVIFDLSRYSYLYRDGTLTLSMDVYAELPAG
ncbi:hypothetical protein JW859_04620 [bacterium]|nr:hypothetical protein [bacterium]